MGFGNNGAAIPTPLRRDERGLLEKLFPFLPPWLLTGALWLVALLAYNMWGTNPAALPWAACGLTLATAALTTLTAKVTSQSRPSQQIHTTVTVAGALGWLTIATIAGPATHPLVDVWLIAGPAVALSWNIRRMLKGSNSEKESNKGDSDLFKAVKLAGTKIRGELEVKPNKVQVPLQLPSGQLTAEDVAQAKGRIASGLSVPKNGVRVNPDPEHHDRATVTIVPQDMLKKPTPWPGPSAFGGSILEPLQVGLYEDGEPMRMWLPGDPSQQRNATHGLAMGMNGAGKSHGGKLAWTEILTRCDVCLWLADPVKGKQTLGAFLPFADWVAMDKAGSQAMVDCLLDVIKARANELGRQGMEQWVPGCGMPYLVVWIEEASLLLRDDEQAIDLVQQGRSAGVSIIFSLQRPSYRNMTTDVRQQLGLVWCFGVKGIEDAAFAMSEELIDAGANPAQWKNQKPGYNYLEAPGIDEDRMTVPGRTYNTSEDDMVAAMEAAAEFRPQADEVTARAAGTAYANRHKASRKAAESAQDGLNAAAEVDVPEQAPNPFRGRLSAEEDQFPPALPENPEPDLECDAETELPELAELQFGTSKPTLAEAQQYLRDVLAELRSRGLTEVGPKDVPKPFFEQVRSRPWVSAELARMSTTGELIETSRQGVYKFPEFPEAAHAA